MWSAQELYQVIAPYGAASVPILLVWLYRSERERHRLQRILFSYLPSMNVAARSLRAVSRVMGAEEEEEDK